MYLLLTLIWKIKKETLFRTHVHIFIIFKFLNSSKFSILIESEKKKKQIKN